MNRLVVPTLLGAFAGSANAQSSVTLFGTIDLNARYVKADGQPRRVSESPSGLNASQFGLRGLEDLGDGLMAGFVLNSDVAPDVGTSGDSARGKSYRQVYVRMIGRFGEIRLGRDCSPSYLNLSSFDVTGNFGIGSILNVRQLYGGARVDNSVAYFLPSTLAGFYGSAMVAASEGGTSFDRPGRYIGARGGYAAGNLDIAVAAATVRFVAPFLVATPPVATGAATVPAAAGDTQRTINAGVSYNFGIAKLFLLYDRDTLNAHKDSLYSFGTSIPIDVSEVHLSIAHDRISNGAAAPSTVSQIAASYVYNLSKRTAVYTTASQIDNQDSTRLTLPTAAGLATVGGKSRGFEVGVRHFF